MYQRLYPLVAAGILVMSLQVVAQHHEGHAGKTGSGTSHSVTHYIHRLMKSGASDDQLKQFRNLVFHFHMKGVDHHAAVRKAELKLHYLHTTEMPEEEALHAAVDSLFSARAVLAKHVASGYVKTRQILGAKIWKKVHGHFMAHFHHVGYAMVFGHHNDHAHLHGQEHEHGKEHKKKKGSDSHDLIKSHSHPSEHANHPDPHDLHRQMKHHQKRKL